MGTPSTRPTLPLNLADLPWLRWVLLGLLILVGLLATGHLLSAVIVGVLIVVALVVVARPPGA